MKQRTFIIGLIGVASFLAQSCYYKPFIGYRLNNKGFKRFSKAEKMAGNNNSPERNYKVNRYDWEVEVFPDEKSISGKMDIHFTTQSDQSLFLFDLQKRMKISSFSSSIGNPQVKRKADLLYIDFDRKIPKDTRVKLSFEYGGKPANVAGEGPVQWKEDKEGRVWISTVTEGIGPQFIMPCNALLGTEADSVTIVVTVPHDLEVASNGKLVGVKSNAEKNTKTYKHEVSHNINTYSISFNIGHFVKITKPYSDINGIERELEFHVLDYNQDSATRFYNQTPMILKELEKLYGKFPFWNDGCKFIESTFSAMEHQSGIAMGSDYRNNWKKFNTTLIHELSHEWWGNSLTGKDYCDIWLHEGIATYSEALVLEQIYGYTDYERRLNFALRFSKNTIPIRKKCNVLYNSWVNSADQDIYSKGALLIHSLRKVVNDDSLFFKSLSQIQNKWAYQNISSYELVQEFNSLLGADYTSLFDWYLDEVRPPVLEVFKDKQEGKIYYKWEKEIPFYRQGEVFLTLGDEILTLVPSLSYQSISWNDTIPVNFQIEKSIYYITENKMSK